MPMTPDSPSTTLSELLAQALDRSVETSLASLDDLRDAVQSYAARQKKKGMPLDSVMRALSGVLMELEDDRVSSNGAPLSDPKLARQLRAWCSEHYTTAG